MAKNRIITLLGILIVLFLVSTLNNNLPISNNINSQNNKRQNTNDQNDIIIEEEINLKPAKSWVLPYLYIKDNWTDAKNKELCTGWGSPSEPFVIENITIDASNSPYGSGIYIQNSNFAYFTIRNCTIYNQKCLTPPPFGAAIFLYNSSRGTIINNNCSNSERGILIMGGNNTRIADNIVKNCDLGIGITGFTLPFYMTYNCTAYGNNMTNCGMSVDGSLSQLLTHNINASNLVNQKSVYFYVNKSRLDSFNFTDPGQIILRYCNHTEISNLNLSYSNIGISLNNCVNATIENCNCSYNTFYGIGIYNSYNVSVKNCQTISNRDSGIYFSKSYYCNISFNYYECDSTALWIYGGEFNEIKNNTMVRCGIYIDYREIPLLNNVIDSSNTVNNNPVRYYQNKDKLEAKNFTDSGQVILVNCNNTIVSYLNVSRSSYGILVYNSQNVTILYNNVSFSKETGIFLYTSYNITISNNDADYCKNGINFDTGEDVNITDNSISYNNETGLYLIRVDYTQILNNTISNNGKEGLKIEISNYSNITKSIITDNALEGIYLHCNYYFNLENNTVNANNDGITLSQTHFTTVTRNKIVNNARYGAYIDDSDTGNCEIYNNSFVNSGVKNAYDTYGNNNLYKGTLGNYWDDYPGKDENDNGIGDTAYVINSIPPVSDLYPIFWDAPVFTFLTPIPNKEFGKDSPIFSIIIFEGKNDTTWYTLGNNPTKYNITGTSGKINQTGWDAFGNGSLIIHFYVNDSRGYVSSMNDPVLKDILRPIITINVPVESKVYNSTAPFFDITITEPHLNNTWYRLWNGTHWSINYTISGTGSRRTGQIDQNAWNDCPNGTLIVQFFANDTVENLGNSSITIRKDIIGPDIYINAPIPFKLFYNIAPNETSCQISFYDIHGVHSRWYMLINGTNSNDYTANYTWNELTGIDQNAWNQMDNGTVIIRFFANDTVGNEGTSQVIVKKDIESLLLEILSPLNGSIFGLLSPDFSLTIGRSSLNTLWYMLINATDNTDFTNNHTHSKSPSIGIISDKINQTLWEKMNNGTVIIRFFLNKTSGDVIFRECIVRKDVIKPNITIILPIANQTVYRTPPTFTVYFDEINYDTYWYRLFNGTHYSANFTFSANGTINKEVWEAFFDKIAVGKNITIIFYCNDTAGNFALLNVTVIKGFQSTSSLPAGDDDDGGGGNGAPEGLDIVEFVSSPVGMGVVGGSAAGGVATTVLLRRSLVRKSRRKEIERIRKIKEKTA